MPRNSRIPRTGSRKPSVRQGEVTAALASIPRWTGRRRCLAGGCWHGRPLAPARPGSPPGKVWSPRRAPALTPRSGRAAASGCPGSPGPCRPCRRRDPGRPPGRAPPLRTGAPCPPVGLRGPPCLPSHPVLLPRSRSPRLPAGPSAPVPAPQGCSPHGLVPSPGEMVSISTPMATAARLSPAPRRGRTPSAGSAPGRPRAGAAPAARQRPQPMRGRGGERGEARGGSARPESPGAAGTGEPCHGGIPAGIAPQPAAVRGCCCHPRAGLALVERSPEGLARVCPPCARAESERRRAQGVYRGYPGGTAAAALQTTQTAGRG